jgi:hypothetical protein
LEAGHWFPERDSTGNPLRLTQQFPWARPEDVLPYLVQAPTTINEVGYEDADLVEYDRLNVPARPGDKFRRFDSCAALDFLRLLGIRGIYETTT